MKYSIETPRKPSISRTRRMIELVPILQPAESPNQFLGTFAKLRKATVSFVVSVHPSVCLSVRLTYVRPHGTTWLPL